MDLAPGLDPCLSWWGLGGTLGPTPLGHAHSLAPTETEKEAKHRLAFVRRENWLLLLHAGAPGTDMKRVLWAPLLNLYTLGTMSPRHILCTSITYATPCVPHTLCSVCTLMHVPRCGPWTPYTWIVLRAPRHICCMMHSVLHTIF